MLRTSQRQVLTTSVVWRQVLYSRAFTIFAILGITVLAVAMIKEIIRQVEINQQITALEQQIGALQQQNSELDTLLEYFNSSAFQEKQMKERLNMQAPGERVVMIPNEAMPDSGTVQVVPVQPEAPVSNVIKWRKYFFNY